MTDRWVQVQGGPPTLIFTINDLYGSAAVCIKNRSSTKAERVSVHVHQKENQSQQQQQDQEENSNSASSSEFTLLCDANGAQTVSSSAKELDELNKMVVTSRGGGNNTNSNKTSTSHHQFQPPAFAIIPPNGTVVAAVISPKITSSNSELIKNHKLPPGLVVQVFSVLSSQGGGADGSGRATSIAESMLTEAEMKSREIDQWLKSRKQRTSAIE